jgi:hypothetical protein
MPRVEFELRTPMFEQPKTVHALDRKGSLISYIIITERNSENSPYFLSPKFKYLMRQVENNFSKVCVMKRIKQFNLISCSVGVNDKRNF